MATDCTYWQFVAVHYPSIDPMLVLGDLKKTTLRAGMWSGKNAVDDLTDMKDYFADFAKGAELGTPHSHYVATTEFGISFLRCETVYRLEAIVDGHLNELFSVPLCMGLQIRRLRLSTLAAYFDYNTYISDEQVAAMMASA